VIKGVDFRQADTATDYVVVISNGSGIKTAVIASKGFSAAWTWARGFAQHTQNERGERWDIKSVDSKGEAR
jgi:hypothetical protein